jgi:hypothetical protein
MNLERQTPGARHKAKGTRPRQKDRKFEASNLEPGTSNDPAPE